MSIQYSIGEFAKKTGMTIRALRYYDEINLLKPFYISPTGRRFYTEDNIMQLQKIVSLKFLGYPLEKIHELIHLQNWDLQESLEFQRHEMIQKRDHLNRVIRALDHALFIMEEQNTIDATIFMSLIHNIHKEEEQKEWFTNYLPKEAVEKMFDLPEEKYMELNNEITSLFSELKAAYGQDPESPYVQALLKQYFDLALVIYPETFELMENLEKQEIESIEDEDMQLFPSPFSPEEEKWLVQALQYYWDTRGAFK